MTGATTEGIDINIDSASGTFSLALSELTLSASGTALDITRVNGSVTITAFHDLTVLGTSGGAGISVSGGGGAVTFDQTPGGAIQPVPGGAYAIGTPGDRIGGSGLALGNVAGTLNLANAASGTTSTGDLDVFSDTGAALTISGVAGFTFRVTDNAGTLVSDAGPAAVISSAAVDLDLALLTSNASPSSGVSLTGVTGSFSAPAGSAITNPANGFVVSGGTVGLTYGGTISDSADQGGTQHLVRISGSTGGTKSFTGAITDSDAGDDGGISLTSNGGTTISFSGGLTLSTSTAPAFTATGGGTVTVTGTNTLASTTGTALNVANTTIGATGLTFRSISANGAANGIVLLDTGSSGSLVVTGGGSAAQGGDFSGGTIQGTTGHGISLTNTTGPSFRNMRLLNTGDSGINGTQVGGFSFTDGTITGAGNASDENSITFDDSLTATPNLTGVVTITNNVIDQTEAEGIDILNFGGTISDADISGNALSDTGDIATPGSAISLIGSGTPTSAATITTATIANNTIVDFRAGVGIQVRAGNPNAGAPSGSAGTAGSLTNVISITGNSMNGGSGGIGNQPDRFFTGGVSGNGGQGNFVISNNGTAANRLRNIDCIAIEVQMDGPVTMTSTVSNNFINANSAVGCAGIAVGTDDPNNLGPGTHSTVITGNNVMGTDGPGIFPIVRASGSTMFARVLNNVVAAPIATNAARAGIRVDSGSAVGDTTMCLEISGNTTAGSTNTLTATTSPGINLRKQGTDPTVNTFGIEGMATTSSPGVENYVNGLNTSTSGTFGTGGTALLSAASGFTNCSAP